ncbi:MAG: sensor histidine kinase/response regulator [Myxococcaceae bacterium]|nr:sensor histidine kinase/response regulator [Myxococcaceae bacterium]
MLSSVHTIERQSPARAGEPPGAWVDPEWTRAGHQAPLIVLIDDNADIVEAATEALLERRYRVAGYYDASAALEAMEAGEVPSLIVLDLMMPRMDGWTFRVKQKESARLRDVPVIVMSASGSAQAQAIDAAAVLRKPLSMERFCSAVVQTLATAERRNLMARSVEIERLRALGYLAASVAHEINNPLTYIGGNLDLALLACRKLPSSNDLAASAKALEKSLVSARAGTDVVADVVAGLLLFARSENEQDQSADVTRSLEAALRLARTYASARARMELRSSGALPPVVGHQGRLCQVFLNLIMNAAQAIEPGQAQRNSIVISTRCETRKVVVEISDSGEGISPDHLARVFDDFFTTKPAGQGTGIGLSFCKNVLERAGGSIRISSQKGQGTTVTVELRLAPS